MKHHMDKRPFQVLNAGFATTSPGSLRASMQLSFSMPCLAKRALVPSATYSTSEGLAAASMFSPSFLPQCCQTKPKCCYTKSEQVCSCHQCGLSRAPGGG